MVPGGSMLKVIPVCREALLLIAPSMPTQAVKE